MSRFDTDDGPPRPDSAWNLRSVSTYFRFLIRRWHAMKWAVAAGAALVLILSVTGARSSALQARDKWGQARSVWVATRPIAAGQLIAAGEVEHLNLPAGAIPDDAIADDPTGIRTHDAMTSGEVIRLGRLAPESGSEMAALLPAGTRGITIRIDDGAVVVRGDLVDLVAMVGGRPVATSTVVISAGDGWATFAVPESMVSAVVNELSVGGVVPVLAP